MKTYDLILKLLKTKPQTRNSDKLLFTEVLRYLGAIKTVTWFGQDREAVMVESLLSGNLPSFETIRRTRQKLQETKPELGATSNKVIEARHQKQSSKGTFIYREQLGWEE
jgi:hypothetical protein